MGFQVKSELINIIIFNNQICYTAAAATAPGTMAVEAAAVAAASGVACHIRRCGLRTWHAAVCGRRNLPTTNELRPFPGPDSYAWLYLLVNQWSHVVNLDFV